MTSLDRLRDEIAGAVIDNKADLYASNWLATVAADAAIDFLTRHIPADVLAGLLDGTMVAVPVEPNSAMITAGQDAGGPITAYRAMLAAAKPEDRA